MRNIFCIWQNVITSQQKQKEYQRVKAETQKKIRDIKNKWWEEKAKTIQGSADQHGMHNVFQATKAIYESSSNYHTPLQSQDGTLLNYDTAIQQRWIEHFELLLNRKTVVTEDTSLSIPQQPERPSLEILPTLDEIQRATMQMKNQKACGPDGNPTDIFIFLWRESSKQTL